MWLGKNDSSDIIHMEKKSKELARQLERLNSVRRKLKRKEKG